MVIEDDYDAEYRYDREPVTALQGLAPDLVVHAGTASKTLAPALRLAWTALPTVTGLDLTLLPPLQFTTPAGAIPRVFNVCGYYQQLERGEFVTLSDGFIDMFTGEPC